jgi:hypothetical protein
LPVVAIETIVEPRRRDLGGFEVGRVLPSAGRRMVGPFIFFDEMGPAEFGPGEGIDVRPHPHIGLATVTYVFEGEIRHRDSLGFDQVIRPGDINWMIAGRGIVHSERTDDHRRKTGQRLHGIQCWIALPDHAAETAPAFHHHPKSSLPAIERGGARMRLLLGEAFGERAPAEIFSPIFYFGVEADKGAHVSLPSDHDERALYILDGGVDIDGERHGRGEMIIFAPGADPRLNVTAPLRAMLLGGAPLGPRRIWWNFVASTQERIDAARRDWAASAAAGFAGGAFALPPGEEEFIPLPQD